MSYQVTKVEVWAGDIDDKAGGLAARLEPLADAGADLQFLIARRQPHQPGKGVVFLSGLKGAKAARAAKAAGLSKANDLFSLRVEGPNKPGACHALMRRLADAGISLRGVSAGVMSKKFLLFLAFDTADDASTAARLLRSSGVKKK